MKYSILVFLVVAFLTIAGSGRQLIAQGDSKKKESISAKQEFDDFQRSHSTLESFVSPVSQKIQDTITAYETKQRLPNGRRYGDSVRFYSLIGKNTKLVRQEMGEMNCVYKEDFIRSKENNLPILHLGHSIPMWIFTCADGGVFRVKPEGDPTSPTRPQIHASKSLRFPFDAKFENYSDEVVKIDQEGHAVPKSRLDLAPKHLMAGWSEDAHFDLLELAH